MSAPTKVIMNTNTNDKASTLKLTEQEKFAVCIHCHKVWVNALSAGGACKNWIPRAIAIMAATLTVPAPINAMIVLGKRLPARDNTRKPANGKAGINASKLFILHCL